MATTEQKSPWRPPLQLLAVGVATGGSVAALAWYLSGWSHSACSVDPLSCFHHKNLCHSPGHLEARRYWDRFHLRAAGTVLGVLASTGIAVLSQGASTAGLSTVGAVKAGAFAAAVIAAWGLSIALRSYADIGGIASFASSWITQNPKKTGACIFVTLTAAGAGLQILQRKSAKEVQRPTTTVQLDTGAEYPVLTAFPMSPAAGPRRVWRNELVVK